MFGQYNPGSGRKTIAQAFDNRPVDIIGKPRKVSNNTFRWFRADGAEVIRLHYTDVVIKHPDGRVTLNSGGFRTPTTKSRLNVHCGVRYSVFSEKGIWVVRDRETNRSAAFFDGMTLPMDIDNAQAIIAGAETTALAKKINAFVKKVDAGYERPSAGDCWVCKGMFAERPDCLVSHLDEGYLHGTLIVNALKWAGYKDQQLPYVFGHKDIVKRALRRYLRRQLGIG